MIVQLYVQLEAGVKEDTSSTGGAMDKKFQEAVNGVRQKREVATDRRGILSYLPASTNNRKNSAMKNMRTSCDRYGIKAGHVG